MRLQVMILALPMVKTGNEKIKGGDAGEKTSSCLKGFALTHTAH